MDLNFCVRFRSFILRLWNSGRLFGGKCLLHNSPAFIITACSYVHQCWDRYFGYGFGIKLGISIPNFLVLQHGFFFFFFCLITGASAVNFKVAIFSVKGIGNKTMH